MPPSLAILPKKSEAVRRDEEALKRITKARTHVLLDRYFWGALGLRLKLKIDRACKHGAWTDGVHLGFKPEFILSLTFNQLKGLVFHEIAHAALGDAWRRGNREKEDWGKACDYRINLLALELGYELPEGGLIEHAFKSMSAERIYEAIHQDRPQDAGQGQTQQSNDQDVQQSQPSGSDDDQDDQQQQPSGGGDGQDDQQQQPSGSGDGQDDSQAPGSPGAGDADGMEGDSPLCEGVPGEVRDAPAGTNKEKLERDWASAIDMAAKADAMRGTLPSSVQQLVEGAMRRQENWKALLQQFIQQSFSAEDYTYRKPNPRFIPSGIYMPSLYSEDLPSLSVFIDTSASIFHELRSAFKSEVQAVAEQGRPKQLYLGYCDAAVHRVDEFLDGDEVEYAPVGGGGTDFRPVFQWLEERGIQPTCLIFLTDLEGVFPDQAPDYPVLWVHPPTHLTPPWGESVEMRD